MSTHSFLGQLLVKFQVDVVLLLYFLAFVVIVNSEFLQRLQNLLHLLFT